MNLPVMDEIPASRDMIQEFGGYNHNFRIGDHEFFDMQNLTGDLYPLLSSRARRGKVRELAKPNGLYATDRLVYVDGTSLYYNGAVVAEVSDSEKSFVSMGAYLVVWPDKIAYNTYTGEVKSLGAKFEMVGTVTFRLCKVDGVEYGDYAVGGAAPEDPKDGDFWLDTLRPMC